MNYSFFLIPFFLGLFIISLPESYTQTDDRINHGIVSTDRVNLERIDKKINDYMYATVENYNAERWGRIIEHPIERGSFLLIINNDERNPLNSLDNTEKTQRNKFNSTSWLGGSR
jgi:hypothetical protein